MALAAAIRTRIEAIIRSDRVVLFMKGSRRQPRCGFSATTVGILDALVDDYTTVDVLAEPEIRDAIKVFSDWPTIPQLYVQGEFLGGCDLIREMFDAGELHEALGVPAPDRTPPEIEMSPEAGAVLRQASAEHPEAAIHLAIDASWNHRFHLAPPSAGAIRSRAQDVDIYLDVATAPRARGLRVGVAASGEERSLVIENPNMPPPVARIGVTELQARLAAGNEGLRLYDVREPAERAQAAIAGSIHLDAAAVAEIEGLPRETPLYFICHHGQRSQAAAEHFHRLGFSRVHNVAGGIDAWSREVDPTVPRY